MTCERKFGTPLQKYAPVQFEIVQFHQKMYSMERNRCQNLRYSFYLRITGSCHKRQKPQAPTPQAPIRNRQTRKVANAKGLNRNTNLT